MILTPIILFFFEISLCNKIPSLLNPKPIFQFGSSSPCDNFYDFACRSWVSQTIPDKSEPFWSPFQEAKHSLYKRVHQIISETNFETDERVAAARKMYFACLDSVGEETEARNLEMLRGLIGEWPVMEETWSETGFDWLEDVVGITRKIGVHPLVKFHVFIDVRNTSRYSLYIENGDLNLPMPILLHPNRYPNALKAYDLWIRKTIEHIYPTKRLHRLDENVAEIIAFEIKLAKIAAGGEKDERIRVKDLAKHVPLKWAKTLKTLPIAANDIVIVRSRLYLRRLVALISRTKIQTIANYLKWSVIKALSRDTSLYMKKLNFAIDNAILGVQEDLALTHECLEKVNAYAGHAIAKICLKNKTIEDVKAMAEGIKVQFVKVLQKSDWLSNNTKMAAIMKVEAIRSYVGYNERFIDDFKEVDISSSHFMNMLEMRRLNMESQLSKINKPTTIEWPGTPLDVNAYYSIQQNAIFIPLGLLEKPFYHFDRLRNENYGAIGSLIGHEIAHALDTTGSNADYQGNRVHWWPIEDVRKYQERTNCFVGMYNSYGSEGSDTLGENIADNVGLQLSYKSLKAGERNALPFVLDLVDSHENEQRFFISYAQMWCEMPNKMMHNDEDEHSAAKTRVLATLSNHKEFLNTFQCENKLKYCTLW